MACAMQAAMTNPPNPNVSAREKATREQVRDDRLKAALKGNMARRKSRARALDGALDDTEQGADDKAPDDSQQQ